MSKNLKMNIAFGKLGETDYNKLKNLPSINGIELKGDIDSKDLKIQYSDLENIPENIVQDANYVHTDNNFTDGDKSKLDGLSVGTGNLVIKQNNQTLGSFNANSQSNVEIEIETPTSSTDLSDSDTLVRQNEYSSLENRVGTAEDNISTLQTSVSNIQDVIPQDASANNPMRSENSVNDAVTNMMAYYITKDVQGNPFSTKAELLTATVFYSGGQVRTLQRNDYCNVLSDESQPMDSLGNYPTTRYLYNNGWQFQFVINNTALSAEQLAAINSGITSEKVSQINDNANSLNSLTNTVNNQSNAISLLQNEAHTHDNKQVLDTITAQDIENWNNKLDSADLPYILNLMGGNS